VIPPMTNDFIAMFKDSSIVSVITMVELTKMYGMLGDVHLRLYRSGRDDGGNLFCVELSRVAGARTGWEKKLR